MTVHLLFCQKNRHQIAKYVNVWTKYKCNRKCPTCAVCEFPKSLRLLKMQLGTFYYNAFGNSGLHIDCQQTLISPNSTSHYILGITETLTELTKWLRAA